MAQLCRRDVPDFVGPDGADLLQVLWCPLDHPEEGYNPRVRLYWRRSADVTGRWTRLPNPPWSTTPTCRSPASVHPEQVREYQYGGLLPEELDARITAWEGAEEETEDEETGLNYQFDLSLAPGWKVGGFANWSLTDPHPMDCAECGTAMTLLFTADSGEWHGTDGSWRPVEEPAEAPPNPTDVSIGRRLRPVRLSLPGLLRSSTRHHHAVIVPDRRLATDALLRQIRSFHGQDQRAPDRGYLLTGGTTAARPGLVEVTGGVALIAAAHRSLVWLSSGVRLAGHRGGERLKRGLPSSR